MHSYYIKKKVEGGGRIIQQKSGIVKNEQWLGKEVGGEEAQNWDEQQLRG